MPEHDPNVPGPGTYQPTNKTIGPKKDGAITMKSRTYIRETKDYTPGPGAYPLKTLFSTEAPKITMAGRHDDGYIYANSRNIIIISIIISTAVVM